MNMLLLFCTLAALATAAHSSEIRSKEEEADRYGLLQVKRTFTSFGSHDWKTWRKDTWPCDGKFWLNVYCTQPGSDPLDGDDGVEENAVARVTGLFLFGISVTGKIATEIGLISELQWLNLGENKLSSTIPSEIGLLRQLSLLNLGSNRLTGTIPSELGLLRLSAFYLPENKLTGIIPIQVENGCKEMRHQNARALKCNFFSGPQPSFCIPAAAPCPTCQKLIAGAVENPDELLRGQCMLPPPANESDEL